MLKVWESTRYLLLSYGDKSKSKMWGLAQTYAKIDEEERARAKLDDNTVEPLYKGHHRGMKFWPLWRGGVNSGFFSKIFQTQKHTKNNLKWGLPTQAKADTVELCHFVLQ